MSEAVEVVQWVLKFILIGIYGFCYIVGGRAGTSLAIRRFLGSLLLGGGIILFSLWSSSYSHLLLAYPVMLFISLSLGYGVGKVEPTFWNKFKRRFRWGLVMGITSLPVAIVTGSWQLFLIQFCLALFASLVFGIINPFNSAVNEEGAVSIFSVFLVPYM